MKKAYKYKIRPTVKQQKLISQMFGCCRFIYNWGLGKKINEYKTSKKNLTYIQLAKELTILKKEDKHKWLNNCANVCLQQSLRCLDNAYTNFFKARAGFPKFKSKHHSKDVCKFNNSVHFDFNNWKVKIPRIGWVKLCKNREFDLSTTKLGTLTVTKDKCGEYWVSIMVETSEPCRPKAKVCEDTAVGIDLGIKDYAILSDGTKIRNPKFLEKGQSRLAMLQRLFSKTVKDSKRRERLRKKIALCHRSIKNRREYFLHDVTSSLIKGEYDTFCLEDLNVKGMLKNDSLSNSIQSASWSEFVRQMSYKSEWYGKNLIFIGRFDPSSQMCNDCGFINKAVKDLDVREWACPECGVVHDRDINAARNIRDFGLHPQALVGRENKIPEMTGIQADGEVTVRM